MKILVHISSSLQQITCSLLNVLKILMKTYIMQQLPADILLSIFTRSSSIEANKNSKGFSDASEGKESACNAEDLGSIPRLGRSPEEGNGNLLQYSCLGNFIYRGAWWATVSGVAESQKRLGDLALMYTVMVTLGLGFPGGSDSQESACNAEDLGSIPGSGRYPGEGNGNPL